MQDIYDLIELCDTMSITHVLDAVIKKYSELFPDWEITTVSIDRSRDREEQLNNMMQVLERMRNTNPEEDKSTPS